MQTGKYLIAEKRNLARNIYDLTVHCPEIARESKAGQFVHIKIEGFLLRRPISICEINGKNIRIVYEVRGSGTEALARLNQGDMIDMIGPLGTGFNVDKTKKAIVVGGGIGIPPLLQAAKEHTICKAIVGFRSATAAILTEDFQHNGADVTVCTDDGSIGFHGFVTQALEEYLKTEKADVIYTCGPSPMLKGVIEIARHENIPCQVSLEERMACGVGACLVCKCRLIRSGEEFSAHVCKDGPVFPAEEVCL